MSKTNASPRRRRRALPLSAVRAFEASGHLLSFTLAAEQLGITQSAVSRHVRHLEDIVGLSLFERRTRALSLTAAGQALLPPLTRAFDLIDEAIGDLKTHAGAAPVIISMPPTFAIRLGWDAVVRFQTERPDIEVHVRVAAETARDRGGETDIMLDFMHEAEIHHGHRLLFSERLVLVCGAELARRLSAHPFAPALADVPLLHVAQRTATHEDWRMWLAGAGLEKVRYSRGLVFATADMTIQAALKGAGIAVADLAYAAPYLDAGLLVMPHPYVHGSGRGYYVSIRDAPSTTAVSLWQWLLDGNWRASDSDQP